jgi:hypothetical protein
MWDASLGAKNPQVQPWGNGEAKLRRDYEFMKQETLQVATLAPREGVYFDLSPAVDFAPYRGKGFLRFRLHFPNATGGAGGGFGSGGNPNRWRGRRGRGNTQTEAQPQFAPGLARVEARPQFGAPPAGFPPFGGVPGGAPGAFPGMPGDAGQLAIPTGPPPQVARLKQLIVTLVLEQGIMSGTLDVNLNSVAPDDGGWRLFAIPVKDLRASSDAAGAVQRIILTSDQPDTFYLAQAALVVNTDEMTVSIRRATDPPGSQVAEVTVRPNARTGKAPLTLVADVEAGTADPIIEWNFDADTAGNLPWPGAQTAPGAVPGAGVPGAAIPGAGGPGDQAGDQAAPVPLGPRIDATGARATCEYPNEEQNYRVEVTVRDRLGKKPPVKASVRVLVRG